MYKHIDFLKWKDANLHLQKNSSFYKKIHLSILLIASSTMHLNFLICITTSWERVSLSSPACCGQPAQRKKNGTKKLLTNKWEAIEKSPGMA